MPSSIATSLGHQRKESTRTGLTSPEKASVQERRPSVFCSRVVFDPLSSLTLCLGFLAAAPDPRDLSFQRHPTCLSGFQGTLFDTLGSKHRSFGGSFRSWTQPYLLPSFSATFGLFGCLAPPSVITRHSFTAKNEPNSIVLLDFVQGIINRRKPTFGPKSPTLRSYPSCSYIIWSARSTSFFYRNDSASNDSSRTASHLFHDSRTPLPSPPDCLKHLIINGGFASIGPSFL